MTETVQAAAPDGDIDLWLTPLAQTQIASLLDRYRMLLSEPEKAQQVRFHFARDRHRYLVTRALVRTVLSRYAAMAPQDWQFEPNPYGRPMIANAAAEASDIVFNVSHSDSLVVCAVRRRAALGVDTEDLRRKVSLDSAERYFSRAEVRDLRALPVALQRARFLELWTLKESYIKARGIGLSMALDQFGFHYPGPGRVRAFFGNGDSPDRWAFWQLRFDTDSLVSVCAAHPHASRVVCRQVLPLHSCREVESEVMRTSA